MFLSDSEDRATSAASEVFLSDMSEEEHLSDSVPDTQVSAAPCSASGAEVRSPEGGGVLGQQAAHSSPDLLRAAEVSGESYCRQPRSREGGRAAPDRCRCSCPGGGGSRSESCLVMVWSREGGSAGSASVRVGEVSGLVLQKVPEERSAAASAPGESDLHGGEAGSKPFSLPPQEDVRADSMPDVLVEDMEDADMDVDVLAWTPQRKWTLRKHLKSKKKKSA